MELVCSILADVLYAFTIIVICKYYLVLNEKDSDHNRYMKLLLLTLCCSVLIYIVKATPSGAVILLIYLFLALNILYNEKKKKLLACIFWVAVIAQIIADIPLMAIIFYEDQANVSLGSFENLLASAISFILIYAVGLLLQSISDKGIRDIGIGYLIGYTILLVVDLTVLMLIANIAMDEMVDSDKIYYLISYTIIAVGTLIQISVVILLLSSRNEYKKREHVINGYLEEQVKYYEYLNKRETETKKFRHDIREHLYLLQSLLKEHKMDEFNDYLNEIAGEVDTFAMEVQVGNDIVNAVINKQKQEAESNGIQMTVKGHFPAECYVSAYHLCTIFSNLLSNAIEASKKTEKKQIWVICKYLEDDILIEIGNYYTEKVQVKDGKLVSSKEKADFHGWGMRNVEESVRGCDGIMDIDMREGKFVVSVCIKNKNRKESMRNENCCSG